VTAAPDAGTGRAQAPSRAAAQSPGQPAPDVHLPAYPPGRRHRPLRAGTRPVHAC